MYVCLYSVYIYIYIYYVLQIQLLLPANMPPSQLAEGQKTDVQQRQEALLLDELVQIVNMRNELVNHLDSQEKM